MNSNNTVTDQETLTIKNHMKSIFYCRRNRYANDLPAKNELRLYIWLYICKGVNWNDPMTCSQQRRSVLSWNWTSKWGICEHFKGLLICRPLFWALLLLFYCCCRMTTASAHTYSLHINKHTREKQPTIRKTSTQHLNKTVTEVEGQYHMDNNNRTRTHCCTWFDVKWHSA